jgi:outer membrane receptor protein involved in Fe transport
MIGRAFLFLAMGISGAAAQEIVVTGERRAQDLASTPSNSATLSSDVLQRIGAQHPSEAMNRLPGVNVHRNNGMESLPAIRAPVLTGGQNAGSILVLENGVPIRAPGFSNVNQLFETSLDFATRVEVTRGPGSALYGSNAVHGLVNVVTPIEGGAPDAPNTEVRASVGQFGRAHFVAHVQRDPGEGGIARGLGVSLRDEAGWRDASGLEMQNALVEGAGRFGIWAWSASVSALNLRQETAGFIEGADLYKSRPLSRQNPTPEAFRDSQSLRAHATFTSELGDWSIRITPYMRAIDTDLLLSFFPSRALEITSQRGGGAQSALYWDPNEDVSVIVGADVDRTRASVFEFQGRPTTGTFTQGLHYNYAVDSTAAALFAQSSWAFAPGWRAIAGLRGERVTYDYDNRAPDTDVGRFRRPADRTDMFSALTPKLGLIRDFGRSHAWVNVARGARPPQASDLYSLQTTQTPGAQKLETIDSLELGWRKSFSSDARFEIAAYAMEKRESAFRNADGFTVPNGASNHRGVEVSVRAPLMQSFSIAGWVTYARHTYAFSDVSTRAGESIRSGDRVDTAPDWLGNVALLWRPKDAMEAELEWAHTGAYFTNAANSRAYPGHDVVNLRVRVDVSDRVHLSAAVRNLFDVTYAERADFAFGNDRYFPGEPRALTLSLRAAR